MYVGPNDFISGDKKGNGVTLLPCNTLQEEQRLKITTKFDFLDFPRILPRSLSRRKSATERLWRSTRCENKTVKNACERSR